MSSEYPVVRCLAKIPSDWHGRTIFASAAGNLSFAGLREGMLRVAGWLAASQNVRAGDRVAICLPKSLETVQAIYGILAAGAAYVPLQFQGPAARLRSVLDSIRPRVLLTTTEMAMRLTAGGDGLTLPPIQILEADKGASAFEHLLAGMPAAKSVADVGANDLAAVFFTSGSTGEPKGVMWSHRGMAAATAALPRWGRMTEHDRLISLAGLHYAASADVFYPLFGGSGSYLLADRETMFPSHIAEVMERDRTTIWSSSATALRLLGEGGNLDQRDLRALRRVEIYGEPMPILALRKLMGALPRTKFFNLYAASEAFDMAEYPVPRPIPEGVTALPLGLPSSIYGLTLHDDGGAEVARGQIGEIVVDGPSVLLGYWKDPELTATKRIAGRADSYRTGDLAFFGEDGLLHLVGRKDQVVKLRGHRFDLGEIEALLKTHPAVREAVVFSIPGGSGESEVAAAVLSDRGDSLESELRRLCARRLPSFARPTRTAVLTEFPLLSTGKVDRRALKTVITANNTAT
ncbi:MAG: hypothetical protein QOK29_4930 [Rhodospirillaceae bacterium]|nr:hypothetical protein [Rhodospirillaceae bacterium]